MSMTKPARVNLNDTNSEAVRKTQTDYHAKNTPGKISVEAITDLAVELGLPLARKKLNLK